MENASTDKEAYRLARDFWPNQGIEGITATLVEKYLDPTLSPRPTSMNGIYLGILESAKNANMKASVIGKAIDGVKNLSIVLDGFDPKTVVNRYNGDWESVLDDIVGKLNPRGAIRRTPRSIWPRYCQTILSAADFLQQFSSPTDFFRWIDFFDQDDRARASLPMLLSQEIEGFGFALSCDFLKNMGFVNFPKPDVHLHQIFRALALCKPNATDYQLFKAVVRVASHAGISPYSADKVFWLIGSGNFYADQHLGNNGRVGGRKKEFIEYASPLLATVK